MLAVLGPGCAWKDVARPVDANAAAQSSKIFAADGALVTTLHAEENRETVPLERIARPLVDAVVAIEDQRYWTHRGVDVQAVLRALRADAAEGRVAQGGSTITQQYVKNLLVGPERTLSRKLKEASLAYQLEHRYSKERILEGYLNTIYFGNGAYGVQAAAGVYFGTRADELSLAQAATLAGLIRSPNTYDPYRAPDRAQARRNLVLGKLTTLGWATADQTRAAQAEPLTLVAGGTARYPAAHYVEAVKRFVLDDPAFGATRADRERALFTGGLRVHTGLDLRMQALAEQARDRVIPRPDRDPEAAIVSVEPSTGLVRALVGGRDFFGTSPHAKFDLARDGRRQAGSAFKPLVLAAALVNGVRLNRVYDAPPRLTIPLPGGQAPWEVDNYEGRGGGRMDLAEATVQSVNTVYAQLVMQIGAAPAMDLARRMGVDRSELEAVPAAVLGANAVTPLEMATAYATLANRGVRVRPAFVTRVTTADGRVLYERRRDSVRVLPRDVADTEVALLQQVVERGTGVAARIGRPVAGKTGTAQEWRNAWFVAFTPELATAVWVGFPQDEKTSMVPPLTPIKVTGGTWPAQIWQLYTSAALAQVPITHFADPPGAKAATGPVDTTPRAVPAVVGLPFDQAAARLARDGFRVVRQDRPDADYPPGVVSGQTPAGGRQAKGGSDVTLRVSTGGARLTAVPALLGLSEAQARSALEAAGLRAKVTVTPEPQAPGTGARARRVWKQAPLAGASAARDDTVAVFVNPAATPDLLGLTAVQARAAAESVGLTLVIAVEAEPPSAGAATRAGLVWKQAPLAGELPVGGNAIAVAINP